MKFPERVGGEGASSPAVSSPAEMFLGGTSGRITKVDLIDGFDIHLLTHPFIHPALPLSPTGTSNTDKAYSVPSGEAHSLPEKPHIT